MNNLILEWLSPPENLALLPNEIHVWQAPLRRSLAEVERLTKLLSKEEQSRAAQFRRDRDRLHFISGRGLLREILGRYLAIAPDQIQFSYGTHGKPFVIHAPDLQFNVSHGHELALYAVGRDRPVGIDVEYIRRPVTDLEQLTQRFFSKREHATLMALPIHQRVKTFFRGWTCKEAYLKAIGTGLMDLDQIEVALAPDVPAKLIHTASANWWLHTLEPQPDYTAALVVETAELAQPPHLRYWQVGGE